MAALSVLTVKFVAIGLTKELAGNYNSAYGYLQLFGILADFGLYAISVREVSRAEDKERVLGALIVLRSIILVISLLSALLLVWIIPTWRGTPLPLGVTIASLVPFFTLLAGIIRTVFQVKYKMQYVFIAEVIQRIITAGLIGLIIFLGVRGSNDLHIYHLFLFIGGVGAFVLFFLSFSYGNRLVRIRPTFDAKLLKRLLREAAPFGLAFLCMAIYRNLDLTLIALLRPDFELQNAYYGFVLRMAEMGYLIPTFLLNSTLPILNERDAAGEDTRSLLGKTLLILMLLGTISFLFSLLWSRPLVHLLTTESYLSTPARPGADTALRLLATPIFLNGIITYCFYVLLTRKSWQRLVASLAAGAVLSTALNLSLIPLHGFVGAAVVSIVVHLFLAATLLPTALQKMPPQFQPSAVLRWLVFSALLALALIWLEPLLQSDWQTATGLALSIIFISVLALVLRLDRNLI